MDLEQRIESLERRFRALEDAVRSLEVALSSDGPLELPSSTRQLDSSAETPPLRRTPDPPSSVGPNFPQPAMPPELEPATTRREIVTEEWLGQRGLLAIGVALIVLGAGYLVKLAIDRDWISPAIRCATGALLGLVIAGTGWRLFPRFRTYGAALIGCGAAVVYLATWAATRMYGLLPPLPGLAILSVVSLGVFVVAAQVDVEALAAAAALGAFAAPAMLGTRGNPNILLLYSACLAAALGSVAEKRWRLTTDLIALSFFVIGAAAASGATAIGVLMYAVLGASAGLAIGLREGWGELRLLSFVGGWGLLFAGAGRADHRLIMAGAIVLATPVWWRALRRVGVDSGGTPGSRAEHLYFYLTAWLLSHGLELVAREWFGSVPWARWIVLAIPYLAAGYSRIRVPFATVGAAALVLAALEAWEGVGAIWALLALALGWAALDHVQQRADGRWYAVGAIGIAIAHLVTWDLPHRGTGPAFVDPAAMAMWGIIVVLGVMAVAGWRDLGPVSAADGPIGTASLSRLAELARPLLWIAAGAILFVGVTSELIRFFHQGAGPIGESAELASGLSVSAWWAAFAAGLVVLGFWQADKSTRLAGLLVSGLAVMKVVLFDLSRLDALYRVASVLLLGLVSLGVAFLYHRYAATRAPNRPT